MRRYYSKKPIKMAGGGLVKKGGRVATEAMKRSAKTVLRNKELRSQINDIKAQISKHKENARISGGKVDSSVSDLEKQLKQLQQENFDVIMKGK